MRGLFFKIFIIFWIAQSLIFVISTTFILAHRFPRPNFMLDPAFENLHIESSQVAKAYETGGCNGVNAFAQERNENIGLVDEKENMRCGLIAQSIPGQASANQGLTARQAGDATVWTVPVVSETGKTYLYVISAPRHREQHPWYEDLWHFAFPQLPVAIAVGGLTTFVLVLIFTRPVIRLREAARQLAQGRLSTRVKEGHQGRIVKGDEFDALVHDFNHMAERLESLVNAQKLLLRDVSHELRSPLARLSVASELAREDGDAAMNLHLDRIQRETERLNLLIGQLLTLSSMEAAESLDKRERVPLKPLLQEILADAEYEAQQRGTSVALHEECECVVEGRRELLYRAVENVVRNAIRYTATGTQVEIDLRLDPRTHKVLIDVSDRGPGIPEEELGSIFTPFYRVDTSRTEQTGGFGVGLAIAERAVKLHNGSITAMNRAGGGTTIQIAIPNS
jgi:two-component system sensor histidine kinase CpxA